MDLLNLAYRLNGGSAYTGNIYVDWWFYDREGTTWNLTNGSYCDDPLSLTYASNTSYSQLTQTMAQTATSNFADSVLARSCRWEQATTTVPASTAASIRRG